MIRLLLIGDTQTRNEFLKRLDFKSRLKGNMPGFEIELNGETVHIYNMPENVLLDTVLSNKYRRFNALVFASSETQSVRMPNIKAKHTIPVEFYDSSEGDMLAFITSILPEVKSINDSVSLQNQNSQTGLLAGFSLFMKNSAERSAEMREKAHTYELDTLPKSIKSA